MIKELKTKIAQSILKRKYIKADPVYGLAFDKPYAIRTFKYSGKMIKFEFNDGHYGIIPEVIILNNDASIPYYYKSPIVHADVNMTPIWSFSYAKIVLDIETLIAQMED